MNVNLLCHDCGTEIAVCLFYWEKYHPEIGRYSITEPSLKCEECKQIFLHPKHDQPLYEKRPRFLDFLKLVPADSERIIGKITSRKGREANELNNKFWKNKLHHIKHYIRGEMRKSGT